MQSALRLASAIQSATGLKPLCPEMLGEVLETIEFRWATCDLPDA